MSFNKSLPILFSILFALYFTFTNAATFNVVNQCGYNVWAAASPGGVRQLDRGLIWTIDVDVDIDVAPAPAPTLAPAPTPAQNSQQDYLNAHNSARAAVGVGPLVWDNTVAAYAQNYANKNIGDCNLIHSGGPYGENLAKGTGDFTGTAAVELWVGERGDYDYNSNNCINGKQCLHYTQVVWRNSVRIGCARVQCNDGWWFITCNYDPRGNYIGQRPY